jgi:hypothetical protein
MHLQRDVIAPVVANHNTVQGICFSLLQIIFYRKQLDTRTGGQTVCYTCLLLVTATGGVWDVFSLHISFIQP